MMGKCSVLGMGELRDAVRFCNSYNRLPTVIGLWAGGRSIEEADWLRLLGQEWQSCDNITEYAEALLSHTPLAAAFERPELRRYLMDRKELEAFGALPETITVYRGCYAPNKWGLSWSLNRDVAAKFPRFHRYRQDGQPLLVKAIAAKSDIVALKLDRNEAEIITRRPRHVSTSHLWYQ